MRTLKKTLALVLVIAMCLSIGVIGANAAFTDVTADNDYSEAISVLNGVGVINGTTATTFAPDGTLTREQAAKIIAYMLLGPTNAKLISNATTSKFSDVATSRWSAGYIEYCANLGIINGVGDGKFAPEGTLTTAAFTKLLLCALGYKADAEGFTGASWAINVASLAVTAGVYDEDIVISASINITRAQACQLAFLALQANVVKYGSTGTTITVGGTTIVSGASAAEVVANASYDYTGIVDNDMQFCEKYFKTLKLDSTPDADAFGRPNECEWYLDLTTDKVLYTRAYAPVATYDTFKAADKTALEKTYGYEADFEVLYNGGTDTTVDTVAELLNYSGVDIEFFDVDNDELLDTAIVAESYLAEVTAINTTTGAITVDVYEHAAKQTITVDKDTTDAIYNTLATYSKGDFLLTWVSAGAILKIAEPTTVSGAVTAALTGACLDLSYVKVDGTAYYYANEYAYNDGQFAGATKEDTEIALKDEGTFYLNEYNHIIGFATTTAAVTAANYCYLLSAEGKVGTRATGTLITSDAVAGQFMVKVEYMDGTVAAVGYNVMTATQAYADDANVTTTVKAFSAITKGDSYIVFGGFAYDLMIAGDITAAVTAMADGFYTYVANTSGAVTLTAIADLAVVADKDYDGKAASITGWAAGKIYTVDDFAATSSTVLTTIAADGSVKTTTGLPATGTTAPTGEILYVVNSSSKLTNVYVLTPYTGVVTTAATYGYYKGAGEVTADGYTYTFYVGGTEKDYLFETTQSFTAGIYTLSVTDGFAAAATADDASYDIVTGTVTYVDSAYVIVGGTPYYFGTNCAVYNVDTGAGATDTLSTKLTTDGDGDTVSIVVATSAATTALVIYITANAD